MMEIRLADIGRITGLLSIALLDLEQRIIENSQLMQKITELEAEVTNLRKANEGYRTSIAQNGSKEEPGNPTPTPRRNDG